MVSEFADMNEPLNARCKLDEATEICGSGNGAAVRTTDTKILLCRIPRIIE